MGMQTLFPTLIHSEVRRGSGKLNRDLIRESQLLREIDQEGGKWSEKNYAAGYTSYSSITDLPFRSSNFAELRKWIDGRVGAYARALDFDLMGGKLEMTSCWINIMGKHAHHSFHLHPLSAISGTYFLQVPKGAGVFKMEDPRLSSFMGSPPRKASARPANRRFVDIAPVPGQLILFESWLKHEVVANRSNQERISVSFNYDWIR